MSVTGNVINRLYTINPPDTWERFGVDIPGINDLIRHTYNVAEVVMYQTEFVRDALRAQIVVETVSPEYLDQFPDTPSVLVRYETMVMPVTIAECNDISERHPTFMKKNVEDFLKRGPSWERVINAHLETCRDELALLIGEKTIAAPGKFFDVRRLWKSIRNLAAVKIDPIDREIANIRSHWLMEAFFREGVVPHFQECRKNTQEPELEDATAEAIELGTSLADTHLAAGHLSFHILDQLRKRGS